MNNFLFSFGLTEMFHIFPFQKKKKIMTEFIYKDDELKDVAKAQVQKDQDTSQPNQHIAAIITEVIQYIKMMSL